MPSCFWRRKTALLHFTIYVTVEKENVRARMLIVCCVCLSMAIYDWQEMEQPWSHSPPARVGGLPAAAVGRCGLPSAICTPHKT